jgi:uncharacterized protein
VPGILVAALAAALVAAASSAGAQTLAIGTTPPGTLVHALGTTVAKALDDTIAVRVRPTNGTSVLIPMVNSGELDMGFCGTLEFFESFHGTGPSAGRPNPNLRAVAVLFPNRLGLFVRNDSPIKTVRDLKGVRVAYGYGDQASAKTGVDALLANAGLTAADIQAVDVPSLTAGVDALIAGRADVAFFAIGQAKVAEADAAVGIRYLAVDASPAAIAALQKALPTAYTGRVEPAPNLKGIREPLVLAQYDVVAFVNANVSEERVRIIARTLADRRDAMAQTMPLFRQLDPARMFVGNLRVPYHNGALAYYRDQGLKAAP